VWDRFVRLFHWSLVTCMAGAWLLEGASRTVHEALGYGTMALVAARIVWGFVGAGHARFASFVPGPRRLRDYVGAMLRGREPRHLGHNPAAAVMIVFLLGMVLAIGATGFLMTTDAFWGNETVEHLHGLLVDVVLVAVALHISAALYESWRHRENLIAAMVTGNKRAP
jgi:cytochrome b